MCVCGSRRTYTHLETVHDEQHLIGVVTLDTVERLTALRPQDVVQLVDHKLNALRSVIYRNLGQPEH